MISAVKQAWLARAPRERVFLSIGVVFVLLTLAYLLAFKPLASAAQRADRALPELRRQDAAMAALMSKAKVLKAKPLPAIAVPEAAALTQQAKQSGLALQIASDGEGGFNVQLNQVEFTGLLDWLNEVQSGSHMFVRESQLDAAGPGQVSGHLVLAP